MEKPDWFILIERWVPERMGELGVTLPFLVGALAFKAGDMQLNSSHVRKLLSEMSANPVHGYVTEVSWCPNIGAPVFNTKATDSPERMKSSAGIAHPSGHGQSLVFGPNLLTHWGCTDPSVLLDRLVEDATEHVSKGRYSRKQKLGTTEFEYGDFLPGEIAYIQKMIMTSQP